jgi:hypothetical protein
VFSLRRLQLWLALAFAVTASLGMLRLGDPEATLLGSLGAVAAYVTGRALPPAELPRAEAWKFCVVSAVLIGIGLWADTSGGKDALTWSSIALAFCAGNRLKAAGRPT